MMCLYCAGQRAALAQQTVQRQPAVVTNWQLKPSLKYDTLCLLNVLGGDPYYLEYYKAEYEHFQPLFTPEERAAFVELKRIIKEEHGGIISANLALYFSVVPDETLPELIATAHDTTKLKEAFRQTTYWDADDWKVFETARPALEKSLKALDRVRFAEYWERTARPKIEARIVELSGELPKYDIVPAIERRLGFPLASRTITVYLLAYSEPHGIRITGLRFLTHVSYPFAIVLHNAIHEMMHPPYDSRDPAMRRAIEQLGKDPLIVEKVRNHNPSFGYNTVASYVEEDSVQALEEIISEEFGVGHDPIQYWKEQDNGMHVLAAAVYVEYKKEGKLGFKPYAQWFSSAVGDGALTGESLKKTIATFFAAAPAK